MHSSMVLLMEFQLDTKYIPGGYYGRASMVSGERGPLPMFLLPCCVSLCSPLSPCLFAISAALWFKVLLRDRL